MALLAIGINHRTAPVALREQIAFAPADLESALPALCEEAGMDEAAILSTCNRTEIYCRAEGAEDAGDAALEWLARRHGLELPELEACAYRYEGAEAVRHLLRVGAGLDSMILGEPQILGQLKQAWRAAREAGTLGTQLGRLFQHTFAVAKQVRTDTAIGASPVSVAFAAVSLARQIFGELGDYTALLVGAGETIELAARHLEDQGIGRMVIANRTVERAHELAVRFRGYAIALDEIPDHLAEADIVISSTASPDPILHRPQVAAALRRRKHRPMFLVDIAVPRDIDPAVAELADAYLYTVDDLEDIIQDSLRSRQEAALQAEDIIEIQVDHFLEWIRSLDAVGAIRALRGRGERMREEVLGRARQMLAAGRPPQEVLEWATHTLGNKLLHAPSAALREAGASGRSGLIDAARELFRLEEEGP